MREVRVFCDIDNSSATQEGNGEDRGENGDHFLQPGRVVSKATESMNHQDNQRQVEDPTPEDGLFIMIDEYRLRRKTTLHPAPNQCIRIEQKNENGGGECCCSDLFIDDFENQEEYCRDQEYCSKR